MQGTGQEGDWGTRWAWWTLTFLGVHAWATPRLVGDEDDGGHEEQRGCHGGLRSAEGASTHAAFTLHFLTAGQGAETSAAKQPDVADEDRMTDVYAAVPDELTNPWQDGGIYRYDRQLLKRPHRGPGR